VSRTTLVDAEGRRHLGLHHWPDGTIGRFVRDGRIVMQTAAVAATPKG
jgi:hypothetical protein